MAIAAGAGSWARLYDQLQGIKAGTLKNRATAFEEVRRLLDDEALCEQITAHNTEVEAQPSAWGEVCCTTLEGIEWMLKNTRAQNLAHVIQRPLAVLRMVVSISGGAEGLHSTRVTKRILEFCFDKMSADNHLQESGTEYLHIIRSLLSSSRAHHVNQKMLQRAWQFSKKHMNSTRANESNLAAELLWAFLKSVRFEICKELEVDIMHGMQSWLSDNDANDLPNDVERRDKFLLDIISAFIWARQRSFYPILAAHANIVPDYVLRRVAQKLVITSPLRTSALCCLHRQLVLFAQHAEAWAIEPQNPLGVGPIKTSLLDKVWTIELGIFKDSMKDLANIASLFNFQVENQSNTQNLDENFEVKPGLQVHLDFAADLLYWHEQTKDSNFGIADILQNIQEASAPARQQSIQAVPWLQLLCTYFDRHSKMGWQVTSEANLQSIIHVMHDRLNRVSAAQQETEWILKCCISLIRARDSKQSSCWYELWRIVVNKVMFKMPQGHRETGLQLVILLIQRQFIDSTSIGSATKSICKMCDIDLDSEHILQNSCSAAVEPRESVQLSENLEVEQHAVSSNDLSEPSIAKLEVLACLFRSASLHEDQDLRSRQIVLSWACHFLPTRKKPKTQDFIRALSNLFVALTSRLNILWQPTCLKWDQPHAPERSNETTYLSILAEEACQKQLYNRLVNESHRLLAMLRESENESSCDTARAVRQAAQLAYIIGQVYELTCMECKDQDEIHSIHGQLLSMILKYLGQKNLIWGGSEQRTISSALGENLVLTAIKPRTSVQSSLSSRDSDFPSCAVDEIFSMLKNIKLKHQVVFELDSPSFTGLASSSTRSQITTPDDVQTTRPVSVAAQTASKRRKLNYLRDEPDMMDVDQALFYSDRHQSNHPNQSRKDTDSDSSDEEDIDAFSGEFGESYTSQLTISSSRNNFTIQRSGSQASSARIALAMTPSVSDINLGHRIQHCDALIFARNLIRIVTSLLFSNSNYTPSIDIIKRLLLPGEVDEESEYRNVSTVNTEFSIVMIEHLCEIICEVINLAQNGELGDHLDIVVDGLHLLLTAANLFADNGEVLLCISKSIAKVAQLMKELPTRLQKENWCIEAMKVMMNAIMDLSGNQDNSAFFMKSSNSTSKFAWEIRYFLRHNKLLLMPELTRLYMCKATVNCSELWLSQSSKPGIKLATYVLYNSCMDKQGYMLRTGAAALCSPLLARLKASDPLALLHGFVNSIQSTHDSAAVETLRGLPQSLPFVDGGESDGDSGNQEENQELCCADIDDVDNEQADMSSLTMDSLANLSETERENFIRYFQDDETVWSNWNLLTKLACASHALVRSVLFRLAIFASMNIPKNSNRNHSQQKSERGVLRRSFLRELVIQISKSVACPHIFFAQSEFLLMNWVRYGPCPAGDPLQNFPCYVFDIETRKPNHFDMVAIPRAFVGLLLHSGINGGLKLQGRIQSLKSKAPTLPEVLHLYKWELYGYLGMLKKPDLWNNLKQTYDIQLNNDPLGQTQAVLAALDLVSTPQGGFGDYKGLSAEKVCSFAQDLLCLDSDQCSSNLSDIIVHLNERAQLDRGATIPALKAVIEWLISKNAFDSQPMALTASLNLVIYLLRCFEDASEEENIDLAIDCLYYLGKSASRTESGRLVMERNVLVVATTLRDFLLRCPDTRCERRRTLEDSKLQWTRDLTQFLPQVVHTLLLVPGFESQSSNHEDQPSIFACLVEAFGRGSSLLLLLRMNPIVYAPTYVAVLTMVIAQLEKLDLALQDPMLGRATLILGSLMHDVPENIRDLAAQCLGLIGCVDESVMDLFQANVDLETQRTADYDGVYEIMEYLDCALASPDVKISSSALEGLRCNADLVVETLSSGSNSSSSKLAIYDDCIGNIKHLGRNYRNRRRKDKVQLDSEFATVLVRRSISCLFANFRAEQKGLISSLRFNVCSSLWQAFDTPFDDWICRLGYAMCSNIWGSEKEPLQYCRELAAVDPRFSRLLLPRVIHKLVTSGSNDTLKGLANIFNEMLDPENQVPGDKVRVILEALAFTRRRFVKSKPKQALRDRLSELIDPLHIGRAALGCDMPATALMYLQSFIERPGQESSQLIFDAYRQLGSVEDMKCAGLSNAYPILHYEKRNWLTALVGVDGSLARSALRDASHSEQDSTRALPFTGSVHSSLQPSDHGILSGALRNLGLHQLLDMVNPSPAEAEWRMSSTSQTMDDAWDWNSLDVVYSGALRALRSGSQAKLKQILALGLAEATRRMESKLSTGECSNQIYSNLGDLQRLSELSRAFAGSRNQVSKLETLVSAWDQHLVAQRQLVYELGEPLLSLRTSMLKAVKGSLGDHLVAAAKFARNQGKPEVARNLLLQHGKEMNDKEANDAVSFETACVLWACGEQQEAISLVKQLISRECQSSPISNPTLVSQMMHQVGRWLLKVSHESPPDIMIWFQDSIEIATQSGIAQSELAQSQATYTSYLDHLYRTLYGRMTSPEYKRTERSLKKLEERLWKARENLNTTRKKSEQSDLKRVIRDLEKVVQPSRTERDQEMELLGHYLEQTAEQLGRAICASPETPLKFVFRLVGLWFNHLDNEIVATAATAIPTKKLLPLAYQIASRVGMNNGLDNFLASFACDELFDVYPHIHALANGDQIPEGQRLRNYAIQNTSKVDSAKQVTRKIRKLAVKLQVVEALDSILSALTYLACHDVGPRPSRSKVFRTSDCRNFKTMMTQYRDINIHIPLLSPNDKVLNVLPEFQITASGINVPKILTLQMSSGKKRRILLKGSDDLRQDAVIQQLFTLMQYLLSDARLTIRTYKVVPLTPVAGLIEWVENTIPIGEYLCSFNNSGAAHDRYLEKGDWPHPKCSNLMRQAHETAKSTKKTTIMKRHKSMNVGGPSARRRSSRGMIGESETSMDGTDTSTPSSTGDVILDEYRKVCRHFKPVMRFFFLETFASSAEWYLRRKVYTQSVAVNSMVGHIFGVGDRHLQNILIDKTTAELVHIDFGVLFDFGKVLNTPERVPFRLTRDIVDGMASGSTAGTFVKTCEQTMTILRENHELITTICDVLVHDPIYNWTVRVKDDRGNRDEGSEENEVNENNAGRRSLIAHDGDSDGGGDSDSDKNEVAENVLARIQAKLHGREDTGGESLNVSRHVRWLIQQAQNEENLAHMFPGWAPWV